MRTDDTVELAIHTMKEKRHTVSSLRYTTIQFETAAVINNGGNEEEGATHPRVSGTFPTDLLVSEVVVHHGAEKHSG